MNWFSTSTGGEKFAMFILIGFVAGLVDYFLF
jgi:hypothetical protein